MSCCCGSGEKVKMLYSCSGNANTGYLADRVFRKLKSGGDLSGTCLSAVGADLSGFILTARNSEQNIVLDGCRVACGKKIFDKRDLPYTHFIMTDFGVEKGDTEITDEIVDRICSEIRSKAGNCNG